MCAKFLIISLVNFLYLCFLITFFSYAFSSNICDTNYFTRSKEAKLFITNVLQNYETFSSKCSSSLFFPRKISSSFFQLSSLKCTNFLFPFYVSSYFFFLKRHCPNSSSQVSSSLKIILKKQNDKVTKMRNNFLLTRNLINYCALNSNAFNDLFCKFFSPHSLYLPNAPQNIAFKSVSTLKTVLVCFSSRNKLCSSTLLFSSLNKNLFYPPTLNDELNLQYPLLAENFNSSKFLSADKHKNSSAYNGQYKMNVSSNFLNPSKISCASTAHYSFSLPSTGNFERFNEKNSSSLTSPEAAALSLTTKCAEFPYYSTKNSLDLYIMKFDGVIDFNTNEITETVFRAMEKVWPKFFYAHKNKWRQFSSFQNGNDKSILCASANFSKDSENYSENKSNSSSSNICAFLPKNVKNMPKKEGVEKETREKLDILLGEKKGKVSEEDKMIFHQCGAEAAGLTNKFKFECPFWLKERMKHCSSIVHTFAEKVLIMRYVIEQILLYEKHYGFTIEEYIENQSKKYQNITNFIQNQVIATKSYVGAKNTQEHTITSCSNVNHEKTKQETSQIHNHYHHDGDTNLYNTYNYVCDFLKSTNLNENDKFDFNDLYEWKRGSPLFPIVSEHLRLSYNETFIEKLLNEYNTTIQQLQDSFFLSRVEFRAENYFKWKMRSTYRTECEKLSEEQRSHHIGFNPTAIQIINYNSNIGITMYIVSENEKESIIREKLEFFGVKSFENVQIYGIDFINSVIKLSTTKKKENESNVDNMDFQKLKKSKQEEEEAIYLARNDLEEDDRNEKEKNKNKKEKKCESVDERRQENDAVVKEKEPGKEYVQENNKDIDSISEFEEEVALKKNKFKRIAAKKLLIILSHIYETKKKKENQLAKYIQNEFNKIPIHFFDTNFYNLQFLSTKFKHEDVRLYLTNWGFSTYKDKMQALHSNRIKTVNKSDRIIEICCSYIKRKGRRMSHGSLYTKNLFALSSDKFAEKYKFVHKLLDEKKGRYDQYIKNIEKEYKMVSRDECDVRKFLKKKEN